MSHPSLTVTANEDPFRPTTQLVIFFQFSGFPILLVPCSVHYNQPAHVIILLAALRLSTSNMFYCKALSIPLAACTLTLFSPESVYGCPNIVTIV